MQGPPQAGQVTQEGLPRHGCCSRSPWGRAPLLASTGVGARRPGCGCWCTHDGPVHPAHPALARLLASLGFVGNTLPCPCHLPIHCWEPRHRSGCLSGHFPSAIRQNEMLPSPRTWTCAHPKAPSQHFVLYPTIAGCPWAMVREVAKSLCPVFLTCTSSTLLLLMLGHAQERAGGLWCRVTGSIVGLWVRARLWGLD